MVCYNFIMRENAFTEKNRISNIFTEEAISLINQKNILDLGSHHGDLSNLALNFGAKSVTGIEKIKENFDIAKDSYPEVNFVCMDIENEKILDYIKEADVIFCLGILYSLKDQEKFFLDISKNNKIKTIIVDTHYSEKDTFMTTHAHHFIVSKKDGVNENLKMLSVDNLEKIFKNSGFSILKKNTYKMNIQNDYMKDRVSFLLVRE